MRSHLAHPGALARIPHDMTDAAAPERAVGRTSVREHVTALAHRTALLQVVGQRPADVDGQRQPAVASLPVDDQLPSAPIDVLKAQRGYLAGAQPQSREHGQDRVVAPADRGAPIAACQQPAHLLGAERR